MTPLYKDTQAEVDAHNERVRVQREAVVLYRRSIGQDVPPGLNLLFPLAQLRPQGFVGGSGRRYEYRSNVYSIGFPSGELMDVSVCVPPSDRAAASAALTGGVRVWHDAICTVAGRHNCLFGVAVHDHEPEIIAEAQSLLDREGK